MTNYPRIDIMTGSPGQPVEINRDSIQTDGQQLTDSLALSAGGEAELQALVAYGEAEGGPGLQSAWNEAVDRAVRTGDRSPAEAILSELKAKRAKR